MAKANPMTFRRTTILVLFMLFVISLEAAAIYGKNVSCGNKKQGDDSKGIATNKLIVCNRWLVSEQHDSTGNRERRA